MNSQNRKEQVNFERLVIWIEEALARNTWLPYLILCFSYVLLRGPGVLHIETLSSMIFPLDCLYLAKGLLFAGTHLNPAAEHTVISPVNALFIIPPGMYFLTFALGSVGGMFFFLFIWQFFVPILTYRLIRSVTSRLLALIVSITVGYYCTAVNWWSPDWVIQPIMLFTVLLLAQDVLKGRSSPLWKLAVAGFLTGSIMIFKHNIGIIFAILVSTWFLMNSLEIAERPFTSLGRFGLFLALVGYFCFGGLFITKILYFDEFIFYLSSYFIFWGLLFSAALINRALQLNVSGLLLRWGVYFLALSIIPGFIFIWVGSHIGYSRYAHSFSMGFDFVKIWQTPILEVFRLSCDFSKFNKLIPALVRGMFFILPVVVGAFGAWHVLRAIQQRVSILEFRRLLAVSSLAIMGVFLFYPLEGQHILVTKIFIFLFVLFYLCGLQAKRSALLIGMLSIFLVLPLVLLAFQSVSKIRYERSAVVLPPELNRTIGMPVRKEIAEELLKQIMVLRRSIKGAGYYVIGSEGADLVSLLALVPSNFQQYYMEMRPGFLRDDSSKAVIADLNKVAYVVVNANDLEQYRQGHRYDPFYGKVLDAVCKDFTIVDQYEALKIQWPGSVFHGFKVMKRMAH